MRPRAKVSSTFPTLVSILYLLLIGAAAVLFFALTGEASQSVGVYPEHLDQSNGKGQEEPMSAAGSQTDESSLYFYDTKFNSGCRVTILSDDPWFFSNFGHTSAVGDVNGDGIDDLLVGAPNRDVNGKTDAGIAYVFFGGNYVDGDTIQGNGADLAIYGDAAGDQLGISVVAADVNGDDTLDIVVGADWSDPFGTNSAGTVYIVFGSDALPSSIDLSFESTDVQIYGPLIESGAKSAQLGTAMAAGDFNNDGISDLALHSFGGEGVNDSPHDVGRTWLVFGRTAWPPSFSVADIFEPVIGIIGIDSLDGLYHVGENTYLTADAVEFSDINCDGYDDIITIFPGGDFKDNSILDCGEARVVFGYDIDPDTMAFSDSILLATESDLIILGLDSSDEMLNVNSFDVNGDLCNDLVLSLRFGDGPSNTRLNAGDLHIFYGQASFPDTLFIGVDGDLTFYNRDPNDRMEDVTGADINQDGKQEIFFATYRADGPNNSRFECGEVICFMRPDTLSGEIDLATAVSDGVIFGSQVNDLLGVFNGLSSGDVTGDGRDDIIIGTVNGLDASASTNGKILILDGSTFMTGDADGDAIDDACDDCPATFGLSEADTDLDGLHDPCDNCPTVSNVGQGDDDFDGIGNVCDSDTPTYEVTPEIQNDLYFIKTGDINRDNYIDLVYCGSSDSGLFIAYGDAVDTLSAPVKLLNIVDASIAIDYLDSDTLLDIAAANDLNIYVLLNLGDGTFDIDSIEIASLSPWKNYNYSHGAQTDHITSIAVGYIDDDINKDIIISPGIVVGGDGTGDFPTSFTLPFTFETVNIGDFNGDGRDDLLVTNGDQVIIYTNDGSLAFTQASSSDIGTPSVEITPAFGVTDFNRDRLLDFALVLPQADRVDTSVLYIGFGDGNGGLLFSSEYFIDGIAYDLTFADANRDGNMDIVVANSTQQRLEVYYGDGLGGFVDPLLVDLSATGDVALIMTSIDLNRDGNPDLISGGPGSGNVNVSIDQQTGRTDSFDEMVVSGYTNITIEVINPDGFVISRYFSTVAGSEYWQHDVDQDGDLDEESYDFNLSYGRYTIIIRIRPGANANEPSSVGIRINGTQQVKVLQDYVIDVGQTVYTTHGAEAGEDSLVFYYDIEPVSTIVPENGATTNGLQPLVVWIDRAAIDHPTATAFSFQLDTNFFFATPTVDETELPFGFYNVPVPLKNNKVYYWRYAAKIGGVYSDTSQTFAFYASGCCLDTRGNANSDPEDKTNIADLTFMVDYLFGVPNGPAPECMPEADVNADPQESVNISDITYLVAYLFGQPTGPAPKVCP